MTIVLFAIIGAAIKAGTAYWICFGILCLWKLAECLYNILSD
nr:MAG TPA: hypothetical protein [Caudoviricetes sp.]